MVEQAEMVQQPHSIFGLVGTGSSIAFITRQSQVRRYVAVTACQLIVVWDIRKQVQVATLQCPDARGTASVISVQPSTDGTGNNTHLAAGYSSGDVVVFSMKESQAIDPTVFDGHRSNVTSLAWDSNGMRLASAGTDGEIVIWDVVSERGVVRLRGHKGVVTRVLFMQTNDVVVSCGKDGFIKFWDVPTAHCIRTLAPLSAEVWDIALIKDDTRLVIGGSDAMLQVWGITFKEGADSGESGMKDTTEAADSTEGPDSKLFCLDSESRQKSKDEKGTQAMPGVEQSSLASDDASVLSLERLGHLVRSKANRVVGLCGVGGTLVCYGRHGSLDLFKVLSDEEVQERVKKRIKKAKKRLRESTGESTVAETATAALSTPQLGDEVRPVGSPPVHGRLAAVCAVPDGAVVYLAALYTNNSVAVLQSGLEGVHMAGEREDGEDLLLDKSTVCVLSAAGHRCEVRAAQFSSVGDMLVTLSNEALKTWHRSDFTLQCTHTAPLTTLARSLVLAPGDRHAVLGTAHGHLLLVELASGRLVEDVAGAHGEGEEHCDVTSLALTSDGRGLISGGNDKIVRCWRFELVSDDEGGRRLTLENTADAVSLQDGVTALQCSPDGRLLAVATLDNKETLYYADTMKLHQELYGKTLPCTCLSFSSDGDVLVTGCKDTSLRIYGTDFGDMRRLLKNAHTGGVTCVQFQGTTRLFFSAGHDGTVSYWDASSFQRILTLRGHTGIVRCMTLPPKGNWVATGGQDFSLRLWERTDELLSLSEEREEERRRQEEEDADEDELMAGQKKHVEGETRDAEAVRANKTTYRTELAVDMILTGMNMYQTHLNDPDAPPHYLMITYSLKDPIECFCEIFNRIKPSQIEEAVVQLELSQVLRLLVILCRVCIRGLLSEVMVRVVVVAVRTNMAQLAACRTALPLLQTLSKYITEYTRHMQDMIGFNLAGLKQCVDRYEKRTETQLFAEAMDRLTVQKKKRKKKEAASRRAMLTI